MRQSYINAEWHRVTFSVKNYSSLSVKEEPDAGIERRQSWFQMYSGLWLMFMLPRTH